MADDTRFVDPPRGFAVLRESDLDPGQGRHDRWVCRGIINGRSIIRSGLRSRPAACRVAWLVVDDMIALGDEVEPGDVEGADVAVANALARRYAARRERQAEQAEKRMAAAYVVERDTWANMRADLLAQMLADAGSIRKLAREISVPRATLGAWIQRAKEDGTWPA